MITQKRVALNGNIVTNVKYLGGGCPGNLQALPRLVEGALGGYSSFRVDTDKNITDIAKMSPENRKKITLLLPKSQRTQLLPECIIQSETDYLRYQFTDKRDKSIDKKYLNFARILKGIRNVS